MNDQARIIQIAANASSSDVHSASYIQRQLERIHSILDSNVEAKWERQWRRVGNQFFVYQLA